MNANHHQVPVAIVYLLFVISRMGTQGWANYISPIKKKGAP